MHELSRRGFLKITTQILLAGSGLLGLGAIYRLLGYQDSPPPPTQVDVGPASSYPIGSRTLLAEVPAMLIHNESGFSVISMICTHLGCTLNPMPGGFICPCHGSQFEENGQVQHGPAKKHLAILPIEQADNGHLIVKIR